MIIFWGAACIGAAVGFWLSRRLTSYHGIVVAKLNEAEEKVTYSLVLFEDPSTIIFEKELRFRVTTSEEEANRE